MTIAEETLEGFKMTEIGQLPEDWEGEHSQFFVKL
jgi:hypothetical protein